MTDPSQILSKYDGHYFAVPRKLSSLTEKKHFLKRSNAIRDQISALSEGMTTIIVSGTNGKGSVTSATAFLLQAAGLCVGRITSPALTAGSTDMVQVDGRQIPSDTFAAYLNRAVQTAPDGATHYMLICLAAYSYFRDSGCDVIVAETAVGGQFDPTVPRRPDFSVFTNIVGDHSEILGGTTQEVARHKARIIGAGSTVVLGEEVNEEARREIQRYAARHDASLRVVGPCVDQPAPSSGCEIYRDAKLWISDTQQRTPRYQRPNIRLAAAVFDAVLGDKAPDLRIDLASCRGAFFPSVRFDIIDTGQETFVFDGAHNLDSYRKLLTSTNEIFGDKRLAFVTGVSNPDNIEAFEATFGKERCIFVTGHNPRCLNRPGFLDYAQVDLGLLRRTIDAEVFVVCDLFLSPKLKRKLFDDG